MFIFGPRQGLHHGLRAGIAQRGVVLAHDLEAPPGRRLQRRRRVEPEGALELAVLCAVPAVAAPAWIGQLRVLARKAAAGQAMKVVAFEEDARPAFLVKGLARAFDLGHRADRRDLHRELRGGVCERGFAEAAHRFAAGVEQVRHVRDLHRAGQCGRAHPARRRRQRQRARRRRQPAHQRAVIQRPDELAAAGAAAHACAAHGTGPAGALRRAVTSQPITGSPASRRKVSRCSEMTSNEASARARCR